jgi:hypothetical protein
MSKKKKNEFYIRDLKPIVKEAIRRLPRGETRFSLSELSLSAVCQNLFSGPDIAETLLPNYGERSENRKVENQYYEEIKTLEEIMLEANVPIHLADWQVGWKIESADKMMVVMNRRAYAIQIWNWYAIPWRLDGDSVHVIFSPEDIEGAPMIHTYSGGYFLELLAEKLGKQQLQFENMEKKYSSWANFGLIMIILFGAILFALIQGFLSR